MKGCTSEDERGAFFSAVCLKMAVYVCLRGFDRRGSKLVRATEELGF